MNMHDGLEAIGAAICNAYNLTTGAMKVESEFLEYSEDDYASPHDCNFIVNVSTGSCDKDNRRPLEWQCRATRSWGILKGGWYAC